MDIVGVEGVEAEVRLVHLVIVPLAQTLCVLRSRVALQLELLASIATFFSSIGVGPEVRGSLSLSLSPPLFSLSLSLSLSRSLHMC